MDNKIYWIIFDHILSFLSERYKSHGSHEPAGLKIRGIKMMLEGFVFQSVNFHLCLYSIADIQLRNSRKLKYLQL